MHGLEQHRKTEVKKSMTNAVGVFFLLVQGGASLSSVRSHDLQLLRCPSPCIAGRVADNMKTPDPGVKK